MPNAKLMKTLEPVGTPRALIVGDLMLDRYTWGNAGRISPEAPVLVLRSDLDEVRPGGAASVAYLLAGLEAQVSICGVIGRDADGRTLRRLLDESGIDPSLMHDDPGRVTTCKERIIGRAANHPHQLVRVDREDDRPLNRELEDRLLAAILDRLPECDVLLISDYGKGVCSRRLLAAVMTAAADLEVPALVDPARDADYAQYRGAALLKPNRAQAEMASGVTIGSPSDALTAGRLLREQSRVESVLITLDAEGMALVPAGGKGQLFAARARDVYDVTGAGDMALAVLGLCRAAGVGWQEAADLANVAAGLEVEKFGIAPVTRDEILVELRAQLAHPPAQGRGESVCLPLPPGEGRGEGALPTAEDSLPSPSPFDYDALARVTRRPSQLRDSTCSGICQNSGGAPPPRPGFSRSRLRSSGQVLSLDSLLARLEAHRSAGHRIVFTNGCFDLLHVGHVRCLEEAAALGDVLVVAVNSDDSVRRLKGACRPIVRQRDRAAMVAALGCVDYVTLFATDTPHELLRLINPDVLAKGGSCPKGDVEGQHLVEAQGGEVRITGRVRGVSTTRTLSRIVQRSRT